MLHLTQVQWQHLVNRYWLLTLRLYLVKVQQRTDSGAVLALAVNAITCIGDDDFYITTKEELGKENITIMWQGESQWALDLKGYAYDKTKPITRTDIVKSANWSPGSNKRKKYGWCTLTTH